MPLPEPNVPLAQARARWGEGVVLAALFRPGPAPEARTALTRAVTRRSNRKRSRLPARILVAIDEGGRALICRVAADPQGGHPDGDDLYAGPFEELGAVTTGELTLLVLLDDSWPAVLEAVWLDHDAASVAAFLTGDPMPVDPDRLELIAPEGADGGDDDEPSPEALLAEADAMQARANSLRAIAAMRREGEEGSGRRPT